MPPLLRIDFPSYLKLLVLANPATQEIVTCLIAYKAAIVIVEVATCPFAEAIANALKVRLLLLKLFSLENFACPSLDFRL